MGTCLPDVFGPNGYLSTSQNHLDSLFLHTDGECPKVGFGTGDYELGAFRNLRTLSWKGLRIWDRKQDLQAVLDANSDHLENLEIEVADCDKLIEEGGGHWYPNDLDYRDFWDRLHIHDAVPTFFQSLTKLSLSYITFELVDTSLAKSFNVTNLQSLTIRHCRCAPVFLETLTTVEGGLKLRYFELCMDDAPSWEFSERPIQDLLESFGGLQDLYLVVNVGGGFSSYLDAISEHSDSLERLLWHGRHQGQEKTTDLRLFGKLDVGFPIMNAVNAESVDVEVLRLITIPGLRFLGLCIQPKKLKEMLKASNRRNTFEVLHIRATTGFPEERNYHGIVRRLPRPVTSNSRDAKERDLRRRAFGPEGPPKLKVIAYGDFSYEDRNSSGPDAHMNILFCRANACSAHCPAAAYDVQDIGMFEEADTWIWRDLVAPFEDSLRSGPVHPLTDTPYRCREERFYW